MMQILSVGNFLNAGTKRGNSKGFTFKTLAKTATMTSTDNKRKLITVILDQMEQGGKIDLVLSDDKWPDLEFVKKFPINELKKQL